MSGHLVHSLSLRCKLFGVVETEGHDIEAWSN